MAFGSLWLVPEEGRLTPPANDAKAGKDDFLVSKSGETSSLGPMDFFLDVDGVRYSAVVNLVPK